MFCGHWSSKSGDMKYVISHVTSQNNVIEGSSSFMIGTFFAVWYNLAKSAGHRCCNGRDITFLAFLVIKQAYVIIGSGDYNDRSFLKQVTFLPSLVVLGFVIVMIYGFSSSGDLARPRDQRFVLLYGWEPLKVSHHPIKFGGHKHCTIGDNGFSLSRDLVRPHEQRIMWLYK